MSKVRFSRLASGAMDGFARTFPDFVVELRSASDRLAVWQARMDEYIVNGASLG